MAFQKAIQISVSAFGDGTATSYILDLLSDPYIVNGSGTLVNWFAEDRKASSPVGVLGPSGAGQPIVTLSGTVITVTYPTAPAAGNNNTVSFFLLF